MGSGALRQLATLATLAALVASVGCQQARAFLPRTHTTSVSPDGRHTAFVRQGLNSDPPDDHLFLTTHGQPTRALMDLAPDADWCHTIIWTPDSRKVGFVVSDDRVAVFDTESGALDAFFFLVGQGCCGGPLEARNVTFNNDGTAVSFDRVERARVRILARDGRAFEAAVSSESPQELTPTRQLIKAATMLGREVARVPTSRVRLRLQFGPGQPIVDQVYVRVVLRDARSIDVHARPQGDGLIVLPATDDSPPDRLEIAIPLQSGRRLVVSDVTIGGDPLVVTVPRR